MSAAEIVRMIKPVLETFHKESRKRDFVGPMESLLNTIISERASRLPSE
jgi:hypothetical protein